MSAVAVAARGCQLSRKRSVKGRTKHTEGFLSPFSVDGGVKFLLPGTS